ncbi:MAG: hypothetical protein ACD_68C00093G0001 [uncultured bacterium]|nr:MAG: hypothetical protein ACD_68C00093G0001 [uncultured bacterium]
MKITKILITGGVVFIAVVLLAGFGCKKVDTTTTGAANQEAVELEYWRLWDDSTAFDDIISEYEGSHPNIKINYHKMTVDEYENEVVTKLAAGEGPDVFSIHNTWVPRYIDKISTMPDEGLVSYITVKSGCKTTTQKTQSQQMTVQEYEDTFPDVAQTDFLGTTKDESAVSKNVILGIPLSIDTLALYYNKELFNSASIAKPPATWVDFQNYVQDLTRKDIYGDLKISGAAIGTAENINRAVDIMYLLMLQTGTKMVNDEKTEAVFDKPVQDASGESIPTGLNALQFYTEFANPKKVVETWNPKQDYSIDAFAKGTTAMMFNYSYKIAELETKAPNLIYDIAPVPQPTDITAKVNYANYWGEVVAKNSDHQVEAWDFLQFLAKKESQKKYLDATGRPAAHKDLIEEQLSDPVLGVFAKQTLSAKSWYQADNAGIENDFIKMIEDVVYNRATLEESIHNAATTVSELMKND